MMYFSYEDLVKEYVNRNISVEIQELRKAGVLETFMDDVERLSPTRPGMNNHRTDLQTVIKEGTARAKYFNLINTLDAKATYPIVSNYNEYQVGHLQEDIPSVDMESLLTE